MKKYSYILLVIIIVTGVSLTKRDYKNQKKYLPVFVELMNLSPDSLLIQLYFKSSFKKYNIETVSKKKTLELKNEEMQRVAYEYYSTVQNPSGEGSLEYVSKNSQYKVNDLQIKLLTDSATGKYTGAEWRNFPVPIKPKGETIKKTWNNISFSSGGIQNITEVIQTITDSVVISAKLYKD